jgi:hypothetical protein
VHYYGTKIVKEDCTMKYKSEECFGCGRMINPGEECLYIIAEPVLLESKDCSGYAESPPPGKLFCRDCVKAFDPKVILGKDLYEGIGT